MSLGRRDEISLLKSARKTDKKAKVKALFENSGRAAGRRSGEESWKLDRTEQQKGQERGASGQKSRAVSLIGSVGRIGERRDGFALVKVLVVCAALGWLWHTSTATPDRCFPAGEQEYFYDPGNYYQYAAPGGESTGQCLPSMKPARQELLQ